MKKWKQASYLCLPVLALGVSVWAAPHWQDKTTAPKHKSQAAKTPAGEMIPAVRAAQPIQDKLQKVRKTAMRAGHVSCCIRPACDFCISHLAMCQCRQNLTDNKPICRECKGGWDAGDGHMEHVDPHTIQVMKTQDVINDIKNAKAAAKPAINAGVKPTHTPR